MNSFQIYGRLTRDPQGSTTSNRQIVVNFTVAHNSYYYDKNGKKHKNSQYVPITVYGRVAELCQDQLKKGDRVIVNGCIRAGFSEAKKQFFMSLVAESVQFIDYHCSDDESTIDHSETGQNTPTEPPAFSDSDVPY